MLMYAPVWAWDPITYGAVSPNEDPRGTGTKFSYNHRFPGQYYDTETGLHQNAARNYDPLLGRYLESDPIGLKGGSFSTYLYSAGNPVSFFDMFGFEHEVVETVNGKQYQVYYNECSTSECVMYEANNNEQDPRNAYYYSARNQKLIKDASTAITISGVVFPPATVLGDAAAILKATSDITEIGPFLLGKILGKGAEESAGALAGRAVEAAAESAAENSAERYKEWPENNQGTVNECK